MTRKKRNKKRQGADLREFRNPATWIAWGVWLLVAGCNESVSATSMRPVDAGSAFSLSIPTNYALAATADGVRVFLPARESSRSPVNILISAASKRPEWKDTETKDIGGRTFHYVVHEDDGGSGGPALRLRAWTATTAERYVVLESAVQPDVGGDGQFNAEWAIMRSLRSSLSMQTAD